MVIIHLVIAAARDDIYDRLHRLLEYVSAKFSAESHGECSICHTGDLIIFLHSHILSRV